MESADAGSKLGYLPGDAMLKLAPYSSVLEEKLDELLPEGDIKKLKDDSRLEVIPVNYIRGASWATKYIFIDEAQGYTLMELKTILTRIGQYSKVVIAADPEQSDLPPNKQGAFEKVMTHFDTQESQDKGIFCVTLQEEDIVRSEICKYIVGQFKLIK